MTRAATHTERRRRLRWPVKTVRHKLVVLTGLLVAAIALFMYLFFPARLEQQAIETMGARAASVAEMSAYTLGPALDFDQVDEVEEALQAALQFEDVLYAYVQTADGAFVGSFLRDSTVATPLIGLGTVDGVGPYGRLYHVRRPIGMHGKELGQLYMGFSLQPIRAALARSRWLLALMSLMVFVFGVAAAYGISIYLTRPLGEIVRAADRIAEGDLSQRAHVTSDDEVGRLATSFDAMVDSLESAYEALRASEARFRAVIEHTTDVIVLVDAEGTLTYVSPSVADVLGYEPEALVGQSGFGYVHPDDRLFLRRGLRIAAARPGRTLTAEARWRHRDGSWRYLAYRGKNLLTLPGVESVLISVRDVTASKQAEHELVVAKEQAEEMVRLKDAFLANMSHEIRTPLTGILGFAQILADEVVEEQREWVELIERSGQRLMHTLNSVLDLAQLEARSVELSRIPLDVGQEVREVARLLQPLVPERVELRVEAPPAPLFAELDRSALHRVLNNLIGNALKFTEVGRVSVEVVAESGRVQLHVRDTGIGIAPAFLPHLFDEFKQESSGIDRTHESNGLGLAITKQLTELMGGTISVESIRGVGSVFTVSFAQRLAPTEASPAPPPAAEVAEPVAASPKPEASGSVLVVDDNVETRRLLENVLGPHFAIATASNSEEAYDAIRERRYDAVLMDINLGVGSHDGIATMHHLRRRPVYRQVPIIALTACAMPGDEKRFLDAGFDDYLSKPFKRQQLLRVLRQRMPSARRA